MPRLRCGASVASVAVGDDEAARLTGEALAEELCGMMTVKQRGVVARPIDSRHLRSYNDVWRVAAALCKPEGVARLAWQRSDEGVRRFLACVGLVLVPGSVGEAPTIRNDSMDYSKRKVEVWRDGEWSKPTQLINLLTGNSGLSTTEERDVVNADRSVQQKARQPKGVATSHNDRAACLAAFWTFLGLDAVLQYERASEAARASYAFAKVGMSEANAAWMSVKLKTAVAHPISGQLNFHITGNEMRDCVRDGLCVLLIGFDSESRLPSVAYLLHGPEALAVLDADPKKFNTTSFMPRLDPKRLQPDGLPSHLQPFRHDILDPAGRANVSAALLEILDTGTLRPLSAFVIADP